MRGHNRRELFHEFQALAIARGFFYGRLIATDGKPIKKPGRRSQTLKN
jgi:hypothetical protein